MPATRGPQQRLITLGYAESFSDPLRVRHRWRVRLNDRGEQLVATLLNPKD